MKHFTASVTVPTTAHVVKAEDVERAREAFMRIAANENPDGTQGDPEQITQEFEVGHSLKCTFRIALVEKPKPPYTNYPKPDLHDGGSDAA